MKLYLITDICILADVFEAFRVNSLGEYKLDPAYYLSAPQLAWSALMKYINRPIHLITDSEMYRMIQFNIRGGVCHVSVRYARANNKLLGSLYDTTQPTSYILYVYSNNLYGWAMSQAMPDDEFEWLSDAECLAAEQALNNKQTRDQFFDNQANPMAGYARLANELERVAGTPRGYELAAQLEYMIAHRDPRHFIFEVDLEYPPEIHNRDDDYPMAP